MARILIATLPVTGHVLPVLPVAKKLVERGNEVVWYTGKGYQSKVEATGARYVSMTAGQDYSTMDLDELAGPEREKLKGIAQIKYDLKHVFIDAMPGHIEDIENILKTFHADILVGDTGFSAGAIISERNLLPWAVVNITVLGIPGRDVAPFGLGILPNASMFGRLRNRFLYWMAKKMVFGEVYKYFDELSAKEGWPKLDSINIPVTSPYLYLQPTVPGFEYPRTDQPRQVHFVGPLLPEAPKDFTPPAWWDEVVGGGKKVVLVTQGTVATDADELITPALQALADEDVVVVATADPASLKIDIPANAHVVPFVPFAHLMPHVSLMITNGGYGGTTIALAHGVPVISGGISEDKSEVSNRVAFAGVGVNLKTATPTVEQVKKAVKEVLGNPHYSHNARAMAEEFNEYDGPMNAALLLEQLAQTQNPVYQLHDIRRSAELRAAFVAK